MARLFTLGGLSVRNGTVINGLANPRSRLAILAVLAVGGDRGVRREKLAAMFWPESDDEKGRNALRQALFTLKRDLGAGEITLGGADLRLNPEVLTADVTEFDVALRAERFEDAAALYGGPFLDGVFLRESPEFERWAEDQRIRLSREYDRALERAAAAASERGDLRSAAQWWERRSVHDPLSGRVARLYMEALVAAGDRERAIRHAAIHAQLVRQELEAEPDTEVLRLADRLREANGPVAAAPVRNHESPDSIDVASGDPVPPSFPENQAKPDALAISHRGSGRLKGRAWAALGIVTVVGVLAVARALAAKGPPVQPGLVALGAFENRTADTTLNLLADQAVSGIASALTESGHAGVLDLRESTGAERSSVSLGALARRSAAEFLIRGQIDRRGDSLMVTGQVVNARSGRIRLQLEPLTLASEARHQIPQEVRERYGGAVVSLGDTLFPLWQSGRSRTPRYSAYHEFRQGLDALVNRGEEPAIVHFMRAMERDPDFVQAKLWYLEQAIAVPDEKPRVDSVRAVLESQRPTMTAYDRVATDRQLAFHDGRLEDAHTAARAMASLAPDAPDAKVILANASMATRRYHEALEALHAVRVAPAWLGELGQRLVWDLLAHRLLGDHDAGIAEWRRAVAKAPDDYRVCVHGIRSLAVAGREQSVDSLFVACGRLPNAEPNTDFFLHIAGRHYRMGGHRDAAERAFRRALAIRLEKVRTVGRPLLPALADLHMDLGEWRAAYDVLRPLSDLGEPARTTLAVAAAHVGDTATARETLRWLESRSKRGGADMSRAFIHVALGQRDSAIASLQAAYAAGVVPAWNTWTLRPELEPLRDDPRYVELVRPIR